MAWKLDGTYFETCSCEVVCPCTASLTLGADYDRCRVTLVFNVVDGEVDGTVVSGLKVAVIGLSIDLFGQRLTGDFSFEQVTPTQSDGEILPGATP